MVERETEIVNRLGLHARAAAKLVHMAGGFKSRVTVLKDDEEVDGKSILGLMLLAAGQGSRVTIRCEGTDEQEAMQAITHLISSRFDEES